MSGDDAVSNPSGATEVKSPRQAADDFLRGLSRPARILVALSGGSDSTGLLALLAERLKTLPKSEIMLSAATIDHGLRPEAADEARQAADLCASLGVPHHIRRWEGDKPKTGIMAAAREARYGLLADLAEEMSADLAVTAHTLDDQRETLAMRAARRSDGLGDAAATGIAEAMLFDRRLWIARPFLACRRADIRTCLAERGFGWIDDPSNEDSRYERVRMRKQLASAGEASFPAPPEGAPIRAAVSAAAAAWLRTHVAVHRAALCAIGRQGLAVEQPVLAYALSHLTAVFGGRPFGPGRDRMEGILAFLRQGAAGRRTAGGVVFDLRRDGLYLMRESRGIPSLTLMPGAAEVWDGRFLVANAGPATVSVAAAGEGDAAGFREGLPKAAVRRAGAALPRIAGNAAGVTVTPYLAPFDRFLTRFDLTFADRLAELFAREAYRKPPF